MAPEPDIILLDMELPKKDGRQVLCEIRDDQRLQVIPVLVLTASAVHRAVLLAQNLRIDGFMTKPVSTDKFVDAVKSLRRSRLIELMLPPELPQPSTATPPPKASARGVGPRCQADRSELAGAICR